MWSDLGILQDPAVLDDGTLADGAIVTAVCAGMRFVSETILVRTHIVDIVQVALF